MHLRKGVVIGRLSNDVIVFLGFADVSLALCLQAVIIPLQGSKVSLLR